MKNKKVKIIPIFILILFILSIILGVMLYLFNKEDKKKEEFLVKETLLAQVQKEGTKLLEKDGTYIYQSNDYSEPNNYIMFNNEQWRILRINEDGSIRIIRNEAIKAAYDKVKNRYTTNDGTYCTNGNNFGCNVYRKVDENFVNGSRKGTITKDSSLYTYLEDYYSNIANKDLLVDTVFYYGGVDYSRKDLTQMNGYSVTSKLGLLSIKDYLEASINYGDTCLYGLDSEATKCYNYLSEEMYLINPLTNSVVNVYYVTINGDISVTTASNEKNIKIVATLSKDIKVSGNGTKNNPYQIK